jgi:hypothetical protein
MLNNNFEGEINFLSDNWYNYLDINDYKDRPINYLEIGIYYGANFLSVGNSYASHSESRLYGIDPWENYDDYSFNYDDGEQESIYNTFLRNVENSGIKEKITIHRGYSHREILNFPDSFFDIIYLDGNFKSEYMLEDAVLSFRKLKKNGIMICDYYGRTDLTDNSDKGMNGFMSGYYKNIKFLGVNYYHQLFIQKITPIERTYIEEDNEEINDEQDQQQVQEQDNSEIV